MSKIIPFVFVNSTFDSVFFSSVEDLECIVVSDRDGVTIVEGMG